MLGERGAREPFDVSRRAAPMDAFFAQIQEGFEKLGRDISVAVDKLGSDYNRANGLLKRAETARKTGIVTERNASLSASADATVGNFTATRLPLVVSSYSNTTPHAPAPSRPRRR